MLCTLLKHIYQFVKYNYVPVFIEPADWLIPHVRGVDHRYVVFIETGKLPPEHRHFVNKWQK